VLHKKNKEFFFASSFMKKGSSLEFLESLLPGLASAVGSECRQRMPIVDDENCGHSVTNRDGRKEEMIN
jgi:hypothetical protein